jgi:hypothetical protein
MLAASLFLVRSCDSIGRRRVRMIEIEVQQTEEVVASQWVAT